MVATFYLLLTQ